MTATLHASDERLHDRSSWHLVVIAIAILAFVVAAALLWAPASSPDRAPSRSTFTDSAGRTCTQVVTGPAVALDCDFPPAENRLGGFLNDLDNP